MKSVQEIFIFLIVFASTGILGAPDNVTYEVVFEWKQLNYTFEEGSNHFFFPLANVITGVKVHQASQRVFLNVPRFAPGVPATLTYVNLESSDIGVTSPNLIPYPNWEMQQYGNCDSFQYVQSMEIDQFNRLWVIDVGRRILSVQPSKCPAKLVVFDLNTNEEVHRHVFPEDVVFPWTNQLNDIVVACQSSSDCWIYITDSMDAKIIVYNFENDVSWAAKHASMEIEEEGTYFHILGKDYRFKTPADGIAISNIDNNFDTIYYCPLSSFKVYSVPTQILKQQPINASTIQLEDEDIKLIGKKTSQSDGMTVDSKGFLYYGSLLNNSITSWDTSEGTFSTPEGGKVLVLDDVDLQWPDTFGFDNQGYIYAVTNRLQKVQTVTLDVNDTNFRVVRFFTGTKSYMHNNV